jgi:hypothetical protein
MNLPQPAAGEPLRHAPRFEVEEEGEAQTTAGLLHTLKSISTTTYEHSGRATPGALSTTPGDIRDDKVSAARGMGVA